MNSRSDAHPTLIALLVGPALFGLVLAAPLEGLTAPAHRLAAVFVWVVAYWATEAIPLPATSLLGSVLCIVLGVAPAGMVLAPYADPVIYLFVGSFILAEATRSSGLDHLHAPASGGNPGKFGSMRTLEGDSRSHSVILLDDVLDDESDIGESV